MTDNTMSYSFIPETAVGADTFRELVEESTIFVDKSMLIHEYLSNSSKVTLLTYPRRWGKTINMDMIRTFLELEIDEYGKELAEDQKRNSKLFENLAIWQEQEIINKHFGKYPVIAISFKEVKGSDYKEILFEVTSQIRLLYKQHSYLLQSEFITSDDKEIIQKYIKGRIDNVGIKHSLESLSRYLFTHFKHEVIILIDEYDSSINQANLNFKDIDAAAKVVALFRGMFGRALKGNNALYKGLVTGILRIAKADLFSGINNFREYGILTRKYSRYYGFTREEVEKLFKAYGVPGSLKQSIKEWYNGYSIADLEIYNPWSILACLDSFKDEYTVKDPNVGDKILQSYWEESGNSAFLSNLLKLPEIKSEVDRLLEKKPIYFNLYDQITMEDFKILKELITLGSNYDLNATWVDLLMSYLFFAGYLTPVPGTKRFRLPNNEIHERIGRRVLNYYVRTYSVASKYFDSTTDRLQLLVECKQQQKIPEIIKEFTSTAQELVDQFPQFVKLSASNLDEGTEHDKGIVHANEDIIHSIFTYIVLQVKTASTLASEFYTGKGRADLIMIDKQNKKCAILEFKYDGDAGKALKQIKEREYASSLLHQYTCYLIGINLAPRKKQNPLVEVKYEISNPVQ